MPSLTTVTLTKGWAFYYKKNTHTKSISPSSPSFLDITPALQQYLSFPLSSTHDSIPSACSLVVLSMCESEYTKSLSNNRMAAILE